MSIYGVSVYRTDAMWLVPVLLPFLQLYHSDLSRPLPMVEKQWVQDVQRTIPMQLTTCPLCLIPHAKKMFMQQFSNRDRIRLYHLAPLHVRILCIPQCPNYISILYSVLLASILSVAHTCNLQYVTNTLKMHLHFLLCRK